MLTRTHTHTHTHTHTQLTQLTQSRIRTTLHAFHIQRTRPIPCGVRYKGYDDDEFESGDGPSSKRGAAKVLKKYDNIDILTGDEKAKERAGFSLDASGGADLAREREAALVRERLKASATSLDYEVTYSTPLSCAASCRALPRIASSVVLHKFAETAFCLTKKKSCDE